MLTWFLRQRPLDKAAVLLVVLPAVPALWTLLASILFRQLMGAWIQQQFPLSDTAAWWMWWPYYLDAAEQTLRTKQWLAVSGVVAALPFAAFIARQVIDHVGRGRRQSLYGKTGWASPEEMRRGGIEESDLP